MNKAELLEKALGMGLDVNEDMTKAEISGHIDQLNLTESKELEVIGEEILEQSDPINTPSDETEETIDEDDEEFSEEIEQLTKEILDNPSEEDSVTYDYSKLTMLSDTQKRDMTHQQIKNFCVVK